MYMRPRYFIAGILLLALFAGCSSDSGEGDAPGGGSGDLYGYVRDASGSAIEGVVVSDGYTCTVTGADGRYAMQRHPNAYYVYYSTPADCKVEVDPSTGLPLFYQKIRKSQPQYDFTLTRQAEETKFRMLAIGDPQVTTTAQVYRFETETVADINSYVAAQTDGLPTYAITLGDIVGNKWELYPDMVKAMARSKTSVPVFQTIGNHDHDKEVSDDDTSAHLYRHFFGPTYYAFNAGKDYYIVLDNILYKGNKKYEVGLNDQQLNWVKSYLQYVPKGAHLFVCMHAPAYFYNENYKLGRVAELLDLFEGYKVDILSGHTHVQCNTQIRNNIREYNIASIGGAWWLWDGIYSKDGTPIGYQVFESGKNGIANYFKSLGHDRDYQFRYYPVGTVPGHEDELCVKVWNWDNRWKVEYYEDGKLKGEMKQYKGMDPDYDFFLQRKAVTEGKDMKERGRQANKNAYFFFSTKPSDKAKKIKIVVTDANGKSYEQSLEH